MADSAQQEAATLDVAGDVKAEPTDMEGDVKGDAKKDASEDRKADANAEMKEDAKAEVAGEEVFKQNAEDDTTQRCGDGEGEALDTGEAKEPHRASQSARRFIRSLVEDMGERASASTLERPARDESAE